MRILIAVTLFVPSAVCAQAPPKPTWHLLRTLAIRPPESDPSAIGNVRALALARDGTVYVAEEGPAQVTRYDSTGRYQGIIFGKGSGPREGQSPTITLQGDTLVVFDEPTTRLTRIAPDGHLLSERPLMAGYDGPPMTATRDGAIVIFYGDYNPAWNGQALRVSSAGKVDTLRWNHPKEIDRFITWKGEGWVVKGAPFAPHGVDAIDPLGHVVIGGSKKSSWIVISGKDTLKRVTLVDKEVPIPPRVRDSVYSAWRKKLPALPGADKVIRKESIPVTLPPWVTFQIDDSNRWWVGRPGPDGSLASWDLVDGTTGGLLGHLAVPDGSARLVAVCGDRVAVLHEDANGVPWIGVYRIAKGAR